MNERRWRWWLARCLGGVGFFLGAILHLAHVTDGGGVLARMCGDTDSGCSRVLNSRWAVLPPGAADDDFSVPVTALGLVYFTVLLAWLASVGPVGRRRGRYHDLLVTCVPG